MPAHVISSEQQRDRMLHTPIPKLIVSLSIPTLASQLISVFYNTADTYFVSKLSTSASAAVGVVFSLMSIIQAFGFGIGMGCGSIISRSLGNRDNERADRTASSAFFFAAAVGLLICIALLGRERGELLSVELDAPGHHPAIVGKKVHNGQRGDALATAGLAHHAQRFVLLDIKRDAPQDLIFFFADSEGCDQIFYFKHFFSHGIMASL